MPPSARLRSLDVFRGLTIASMVVVNTPGALEDAYAQLRHTTWNGWTFADTIFPFFLWIIGVALTLSTASRVARGMSRAILIGHAVRRAVLLFACGVFLAAFSFPSRHFPYFWFRDYLQLTGVLQKIAVCYLVSFMVFVWADWKGAVVGFFIANLSYLGLLFLYVVPGCGAGGMSVECNFPGYLDRSLLGDYLWRAPHAQDPDGLGAILPAISTVLCGVFAGHLLRAAATPRRRIGALLLMGITLVGGAGVLSAWVPVNKPLWTTSYAALMSGLASICLAAWYAVVDVLRWDRALKPLEILGMNAMAAYVVSILAINVPKVHVFGWSFYDDFCKRMPTPQLASLLYSATYLLCIYGVTWFMYRRRWFLRL